jgi:hypothetical protein
MDRPGKPQRDLSLNLGTASDIIGNLPLQALLAPFVAVALATLGGRGRLLALGG